MITTALKRIVINKLHKKGYYKSSKKEEENTYNQFTMDNCIQRCVTRGIKINTVIDIGASNGCWSNMCMKHFPDAKYLLIEAQTAHQNALNLFQNQHKNVDYIIAAAGNKIGTIFFDNSDLFGGLASEKKMKNCIEVPVTTIDQEIKKYGLQPPYLIKLDTHGFEVPILEGATQTLKETALTIIETYNYRLTPDSLRYFEMNQYMEDRGFSSIEIADPMLRINDHSFWQMDTFYIPSKNAAFEYHSYK